MVCNWCFFQGDHRVCHQIGVSWCQCEHPFHKSARAAEVARWDEEDRKVASSESQWRQQVEQRRRGSER